MSASGLLVVVGAIAVFVACCLFVGYVAIVVWTRAVDGWDRRISETSIGRWIEERWEVLWPVVFVVVLAVLDGVLH